MDDINVDTQDMTEEEIREQLSEELHKRALLLKEQSEIVARLSALVKDSDEMTVDEFIDKCKEVDLFPEIIQNNDE